MLYRYLSLLFLVLLLGACKEVSSSGRYPKDMPPLSEFKFADRGDGGCGFLEYFTKYTKVVDPYEGKSEVWAARYKDGAAYPYLILHSYLNHEIPVWAERWVYTSAVGQGTHFVGEAEFYHKYPHTCEAAI